eukprot:3265201-Alexandrium_andersonii.AAC.1
MGPWRKQHPSVWQPSLRPGRGKLRIPPRRRAGHRRRRTKQGASGAWPCREELLYFPGGSWGFPG